MSTNTDGLNISIYEREADGRGGGKPGADDDTGRLTRLLACSRQQTSTTCFAGDGETATTGL